MQRPMNSRFLLAEFDQCGLDVRNERVDAARGLHKALSLLDSHGTMTGTRCRSLCLLQRKLSGLRTLKGALKDFPVCRQAREAFVNGGSTPARVSVAANGSFRRLIEFLTKADNEAVEGCDFFADFRRWENRHHATPSHAAAARSAMVGSPPLEGLPIASNATSAKRS